MAAIAHVEIEEPEEEMPSVEFEKIEKEEIPSVEKNNVELEMESLEDCRARPTKGKECEQLQKATPVVSFKCNQCSNTYSHRSSLYRHVKREHGKENPGTIECTEGCSER